MQASGTRLLALQRAIGVGYANDVPRAGAHYCTNARSPSSPFPHRYFRVLSMLFGQPTWPAIIAALVSRSGFAAASDDTPQWSLRLLIGAEVLERVAHQKHWWAAQAPSCIGGSRSGGEAAVRLVDAASVLDVDVSIVYEAARAGIPREFHPRTYGRLSVNRGLATPPALLHRPTAR